MGNKEKIMRVNDREEKFIRQARLVAGTTDEKVLECLNAAIERESDYLKQNVDNNEAVDPGERFNYYTVLNLMFCMKDLLGKK